MQIVAIFGALLGACTIIEAGSLIPPPPLPEPIEIVELPLPPGLANVLNGSCTVLINPRGTGCITASTSQEYAYTFQSGDFMPDGKHILALVNYVGAPAAPDPASIYEGLQLIVVKSDGTTFPNGDSWKCITCGVPAANLVGMDTTDTQYPQAFNDGKRVMYGSNIVDCGEANFIDASCTPELTFIYPIRWNTSADPNAAGGTIRELRLHPDNVHLLFNVQTLVSENGFVARLEFNPAPVTGLPLSPRYDLVNVNGLYNAADLPPVYTVGSELVINKSAILMGEVRGFNGIGTHITYVGYPAESCNIDIFAIEIKSGVVTRYTEHPEYCDPISYSPDGEWSVIMDTRGSGRSMFLSGMRYIPPIIDLVTTAVVSSVRNNGNRRFFEPYLLDKYGDRGDYFGQKLNGDNNGILGSGAVNDPNWNGNADPRWSPDGTQVVYYQTEAIAPWCGGTNPLPCFASTEPQGRPYRWYVATLTSRKPKTLAPPAPMSDIIPWATPYVPGSTPPVPASVADGVYTLKGAACGFATATFALPDSIAVTYSNFSDDGQHFISGSENATLSVSGLVMHLDWFSSLYETGAVTASKLTSPDGFHITLDLQLPIFEANGTITSEIDGVAWKQPGNGD